MNIKGLVNSVVPVSVRRTENAKAIKSESATDRDANGRREEGGQEQKRPMTDEEIMKALEHIKNLAIVKEHNLIVELKVVDSRRFVILKELGGKVVRRIPEAELWSLQVVADGEKGQLISKSA